VLWYCTHRYFVSKAIRHATTTGREHRRALPFLPFSVVGAEGSPNSETDHRFLRVSICELVQTTNMLSAERCTGGGITLEDAEELTQKAYKWVVEHYQPVLGPSHMTKLHRFAGHLMDEFRLRGTPFDENTAYNETLHKAVKLAHKLTDRRREKFVEQLIINEQFATILLADEDESEALVKLQPQEGKTGVVRRRRYKRRRTAAQLSRGRKLPGLTAALGVQKNTNLYCSNSLYYGDSSRPMHGRLSHTVRAATSFHGAPWFDLLRYRGPKGDQRVGQAALVFHSRAGAWERLVVR